MIHTRRARVADPDPMHDTRNVTRHLCYAYTVHQYNITQYNDTIDNLKQYRPKVMIHDTTYLHPAIFVNFIITTLDNAFMRILLVYSLFTQSLAISHSEHGYLITSTLNTHVSLLSLRVRMLSYALLYFLFVFSTVISCIMVIFIPVTVILIHRILSAL